MGSSGMGIDANGKPIKRQAPANNNNNKKGGNNQKRGNNNQNKNNNNNNRNNQGGNQNRNQQRPPHQQQPPMMPMVPPFGPMGPGGPGFMGGPPAPNAGFFNGGGPQQNRRSGGGGKNNGNRNGAPPSGYNGPSANNVGQGAVGNGLSGMQAFSGAEPSAMEVPGFGKNSNIHELFGKMIWRKMEQIQDSALVDQLQNRIMNLIHDALAGQNEKQQQQQQGGFNGGPQQQQQQRGGGMPFGNPANQGNFGNTAGFQRF
ncbi:hypothetical protein GCK72_016663 [Caenorhabditis remanei]|uniref:Uncharacterized protein n=1 Tax=Caenorhabditis remanei TaxID=31234 RepID=A0A6A5G593_CAERE|nr:hypothetical protein GCK72_016663 [Caenorhabditis remanei]KAF1750117.1 hypothetical protein GCK72_016663 [Caenorhabditis remanei]